MDVALSPLTTLSRSKFPDELVDIILESVLEDCESISDSPNGFCTTSRAPCLHAQTMCNCLKVSRKWFRIGARRLWNRYAILKQLLELSQSTQLEDKKERESSVSNSCLHSLTIAKYRLYTNAVVGFKLHISRFEMGDLF